MARKIVVLTGESGGSREDGNVYYASFLLVSSDTLAFDEPIFGEDVINGVDFPELADEAGAEEIDADKVAAYLQGLGEIDSHIITVQE